MPSKYDDEHQIKLETTEQRNFNAETLKVLRYFLRELQAQEQRHWNTEELVGLIDNLILETYEGITPEDKLRERTIAKGYSAFVQAKKREDNPHPHDNTLYTWWDTGWRDAAKIQKSKQEHITTATLKPKQRRGRYRVQCIDGERHSEWNETLHQYVQVGGGTLFVDYDEAQLLAKRLASANAGSISIIDTYNLKD